LVCPLPEPDGVIAFIEDPKVVRRILEHVGLWLANVRPASKLSGPF
jgi:hypothetical protein